MDRWKSTARKKLGHRELQKGEDKRWSRSGRETLRREKMHVREKVGKSRNTVLFFQCLLAPEGRKVGSPKRRVRCQVGQMMKDENLHTVVARSTFGN